MPFITRFRIVAAAALSLCAAHPAAAQPGSLGTCCITRPDGSVFCAELDRANCLTLAGQFGGPGTRCTIGNPCPGTPSGACCLPTNGQSGGGGHGGTQGRCVPFNAIQCANAGGTYFGNGSSCRTITCPPPPPPPPITGACCLATGQCAQVTRQQCAQQLGAYRGDRTDCLTTLCPNAPRGACCLPQNGSGQGHGGPNSGCSMLQEVRCRLLGGAYAGDTTDCRTHTCPPPPPITGACCFSGGICAQITRQQCAQQQGTYSGDRTDCLTTSCPGAPIGACCLVTQIPVPGGHGGGGSNPGCRPLSQARCLSLGGAWAGAGTDCRTHICVPPFGACCVPALGGGFNCIIVSQSTCTTVNGRYRGDGVPCAGLNCVQRCPCDFNNDGVVNAADEAAFLAAWTAGNADIDQDGDTDLDDFAAFYACYPQGCP